MGKLQQAETETAGNENGAADYWSGLTDEQFANMFWLSQMACDIRLISDN